MVYIKYLLLIIYFFYSTAVFSCGALNGKGFECNLNSLSYDVHNILLDNKIFFYFKNKEVYQVYSYPESNTLKLKESNLGFYDLNSEAIKWDNNKYILNRKNFELKINLNDEYKYSCILLGRPMHNIVNHFRIKLEKFK